MPRDKDLKRIVRTRMSKTGESYTTARAHIVDKAEPIAAPAAQPAAPDYAAIAGMTDEKVKAKTGRDWVHWVHALDRRGADKLTHGEIADIVREKYEIDSWWAQTVTVGYERIKGLRDRGQQRSGTYEVNKSKTINVPVDVLFDAWLDDDVRRSWLTGTDPVVRTATKPRSLRLGWHDGTLVVVGFSEKAASKSVVTLTHSKLPDRAAAEGMKAYWSERLDALATRLVGQ